MTGPEENSKNATKARHRTIEAVSAKSTLSFNQPKKRPSAIMQAACMGTNVIMRVLRPNQPSIKTEASVAMRLTP